MLGFNGFLLDCSLLQQFGINLNNVKYRNKIMKRFYLISVMFFLILGLSSVVLATEPIQKCGLNIFFVKSECDDFGYEKAYLQCCDGYEEELENGCNLPETWRKIAETACDGHCVNTTIKAIEPPKSVSEGYIRQRMMEPPEPFTSVECKIIDDLLERYAEDISNLRKAELEGDEQKVAEIRNTITRSKQQIAEYTEKCQAQVSSPDALISAPTLETKTLKQGIEEIKAVEISNLARISIKPGEININNVTEKTTHKRILVDVGNKQINIMPRETEVVIKDGNFEVTAEEVSVKENSLKIGNSSVKVVPSQVLEKHRIIMPRSIELKEENEKAVYKIRLEEKRWLLGFIPVKVETTLTTDASDIEAEIIKKESPWWAFLTFNRMPVSSFGNVKPPPTSLGEKELP